jgi:hypothetical protein
MRRDPGGFELALEPFPVAALHRDRQVVMTTEHLGVLLQTQAGEVEEREGVAVADVEEEMGRTDVVAVLEQLGQRELEQALVEVDRALHIRGDQGLVMHATRR